MTRQTKSARVSKQLGACVAVWLARAYNVLLAGLVFVRIAAGESFPLLFALNAFLLYAFLPLPFAFIAGVAFRRISLLALSVIGFAAWFVFWGRLFLPRASTGPVRPSLIVLSYNALGFNLDAADTVDVIRRSGADLVALQELNPETATLIENELGKLYPYRWLDARHGVAGGGILSKLPLTRSPPDTLPGTWVGVPMVATIAVGARVIQPVSCHALS